MKILFNEIVNHPSVVVSCTADGHKQLSTRPASRNAA